MFHTMDSLSEILETFGIISEITGVPFINNKPVVKKAPKMVFKSRWHRKQYKREMYRFKQMTNDKQKMYILEKQLALVKRRLKAENLF